MELKCTQKLTAMVCKKKKKMKKYTILIIFPYFFPDRSVINVYFLFVLIKTYRNIYYDKRRTNQLFKKS